MAPWWAGWGSGQAPEPAQRERAGGGQQQDGAADERRGDLAARRTGAELRAQAVVDGVERVGVLGGVGVPVRGPRDRLERQRVGRHLAGLEAPAAAWARDADRAGRRAERDGVDRDAQLAGLGGDVARVLAAAGRLAVREQDDRRRRPLAADARLALERAQRAVEGVA